MEFWASQFAGFNFFVHPVEIHIILSAMVYHSAIPHLNDATGYPLHEVAIVTGEDDSEMYLAARTLKTPVKKLDGMKAVTLFNLAVYFKAGVWEHLGELVTEIDHVKISLADPQLGDAIA